MKKEEISPGDMVQPLDLKKRTQTGTPLKVMRFVADGVNCMSPSGKVWHLDPTELEAVTSSALVQQWKTAGVCPHCGHKGIWISMALVCPIHGKFLG